MRTTIDIPDALYREVKTRAVEEGTTFKSLMTAYIRSGLRNQKAQADPPPMRRSPPPVAIPRKAGTPKTPGQSNKQLHELLDGEDAEANRTSGRHNKSEL